MSFPPEFRDATALKMMHKKIFNVETRVFFLKEYQMNKNKINQKIRDLVENKSRFTFDEILKALIQCDNMRSIFDKIVRDYSAIITPGVIDEAFLGINNMSDPIFNFFWIVSILV